jgi:hypothetical protein
MARTSSGDSRKQACRRGLAAAQAPSAAAPCAAAGYPSAKDSRLRVAITCFVCRQRSTARSFPYCRTVRIGMSAAGSLALGVVASLPSPRLSWIVIPRGRWRLQAGRHSRVPSLQLPRPEGRAHSTGSLLAAGLLYDSGRVDSPGRSPDPRGRCRGSRCGNGERSSGRLSVVETQRVNRPPERRRSRVSIQFIHRRLGRGATWRKTSSTSASRS